MSERITVWLRTHPRLADALLVAALTAVTIPLAAYAEPTGHQRAIGGLGWTLLLAMNVPVAWRRLAPSAALWTTVALLAPYWILDYPDDATGPALLILVYSLAAHGARPAAVRHFWAVFALLMAVIVAGVVSAEDDVPWFAVPTNSIVFATAWILGDSLRTRRRYLAELEDKAARAEQRQQAEARRAVAEERTRIARELHDVVAHSMSVMVVQAGAARRTLERDPAAAAESLEAVEATGRASLDEMRRILGVLRSDEESTALAPAPGLADLERLVGHCRDAGLPVTLRLDGDVADIPPSLGLNVYRVVQESLTNVLKHAGPARADVTLVRTPDGVEVTVDDDGRGAATAPGSGNGLVGMRERVETFHGRLDAGPRRGGGYRVRAMFPLRSVGDGAPR